MLGAIHILWQFIAPPAGNATHFARRGKATCFIGVYANCPPESGY
jgi:hypothetical protein